MTSTKNPSVFIIVLNWNGWKDTIECVHSLRKLHYSNYNIVVVDNASTDDSVQRIQTEFSDIPLLKMSENKGYAGGNNAGIRYALDHVADYIWILNNDTVVEKNALQPLVEKMQQEPTAGLCGSLLIYYYQRNQVQALAGGRYNKWLGVTREIGNNLPVEYAFEIKGIDEKLDFIAGASMMVSREFIEVTGLMNEEYFIYYEEIDWATRGRREKFDLGFAPESIVYHKHGVSTDAGRATAKKRSRLADYYQIKNRLKFSRNFFPAYLPVVYLTVIYAFVKRLLKAQGNRAVMILKLMFTYNR